MAQKINTPIYIIQLDNVIIGVKSNLLKAYNTVGELLPANTLRVGQGYHTVRRLLFVKGSFMFKNQGQPAYIIKKMTVS